MRALSYLHEKVKAGIDMLITNQNDIRVDIIYVAVCLPSELYQFVEVSYFCSLLLTFLICSEKPVFVHYGKMLEYSP